MRNVVPKTGVGRWIVRATVVVALALCFGYLPYQVYGGTGLGRLRELRRELQELKGRSQVVEAENRRLRREVTSLRDDPRAIERVAREELGLIKPGEIVFRIEDAE